MAETVVLIVGLGQIGASIGLALEKYRERLVRIGHTHQYGQGNQAKKMGAIDKVALNLPSAVDKADIVILALPVSEVQKILEVIAPDLKAGAVVLDTSPARQASSDWAQDILPEDRHYVGFTPVLNAQSLHGMAGGINEADAQLFQDGMFALTSPLGTSSEALKVATDLATMMDAVPLFADVVEIDSYLSRVHLLPQLLAASLANITVDSPGWGEGRKLAGRPYAQLTNLIAAMDRADSVALAAQLNKEHVLRSLDSLIGELEEMRAELANGESEPFETRIQRALQKRQRWWTERQRAEWLSEQRGQVDFSEAGSMFGQLIGYGKPRRKRSD